MSVFNDIALTFKSARLRLSSLLYMVVGKSPSGEMEVLHFDGSGNLLISGDGATAGSSTVSSSSVTTSGTVPAGSSAVTFIFGSTFSGTVNGVDYVGSTDSSISFASNNGKLLSIAYTVSAGTLRILKVTPV